MYPFLHFGAFSIGTFGLMLWLAAVCACWVLLKSFARRGISAVAIGIVAVATVAGIIGAKLWHVLETPQLLFSHPVAMLFDRSGFAWFGGLIAGILVLMWQGHVYKVGTLRMLDLSAPAAAVGYAMGRLGCFTSGDGDYGIATSLPWGISFPNGLVPTTARVHPTPIYELIAGLLIGWILWRRGASHKPVGQLTGEYLVLTGIARFAVEFIRINPRIYWGMSNAQLASAGSVIFGALMIVWAKRRGLEKIATPADAVLAPRS